MKGKIKIITDSGSSLPPFLIEKFNIAVIQINAQIDDNTVDTESLDNFYAAFERGKVAKTSAPSPGDFYEAYRKFSREYETIISIHVSGKLSGTYQAAVIAKDMIPEADIKVIDSEAISMATGFIVLAAARASLDGKLKEDIFALVERIKDKVNGVIALPTLEYLAKSGRVSQVKSLLGTILSLKPILSLKSGEIKLIDKTRSFTTALTRVAEIAREQIGSARVKIAVIHSDAKNQANDYLQKIKDNFNYAEAFITDIGSVLAVHGGKNMIGIAWMILD